MENDKTVSAFIAEKMAIDAAIKEISEHSDDFFGVSPDHANWADVTFLRDVGKKLSTIADRLARRGEYSIQGATNAS